MKIQYRSSFTTELSVPGISAAIVDIALSVCNQRRQRILTYGVVARATGECRQPFRHVA